MTFQLNLKIVYCNTTARIFLLCVTNEWTAIAVGLHIKFFLYLLSWTVHCVFLKYQISSVKVKNIANQYFYTSLHLQEVARKIAYTVWKRKENNVVRLKCSKQGGWLYQKCLQIFLSLFWSSWVCFEYQHFEYSIHVHFMQWHLDDLDPGSHVCKVE